MQFLTEFSKQVWETKYRAHDSAAVFDKTIEDTWRRVASALSTIESTPEYWGDEFYHCIEGFEFLPGGRILATAGTKNRATLFNCFVMGKIEDSMDGIFDALKEGALTMQQGGGVGYDFSTLRPKGTPAHATGRIASGPVSFMRIWNTMCATILTTGARRGAMMATLRCDHPDIYDFVRAKSKSARDLNHFNLSVLATDDFVKAVRNDAKWQLSFQHDGPGEDEAPISIKQVRARELWQDIMECTYKSAEPGILFIDRINRENNLWYVENISATNPCGEIPLPQYGACDLGSINLVNFVNEPFTTEAEFDFERLAGNIPTYVRLLDNVIDVSNFPLVAQREQAQRTRRIGLGVTGLGDALAMLGLNYRSQEARDWAAKLMKLIRDNAYEASIELSREKGPFPLFNKEKYLRGEFIKRLPERIRAGIVEFGIRNSHLLAIAPTGTISLLANNISSGIEPIFSPGFHRRVLQVDGTYLEYDVVDYAVAQWRRKHGIESEEAGLLSSEFVFAHEIEPEEHLLMQAALQPYVDNSISKTINVAEDTPFERFSDIYSRAYDLGLKGCTTFRNNPVTGSILTTNS